MESALVRYSDDFFSKASIYWHPLFPLLARTFEHCQNATNGALNRLKPVGDTFKNDAQIFVDYVKKSKPPHYPNKEVDSLVVSCISELRSHLLLLEQVDHLVDTFCQNFTMKIKRNLSFDSIFGSEDPFSNFDSSSEDGDDWFNEILDGHDQKAKRPKLDSDWIRKYSNIIPDYMSNNVPICTEPIGSASHKDSFAKYRGATQIFQSPKIGGDGTCTAFRSVEYVVWENGSKLPSMTATKPPKPTPVKSQGFAEYKKPTIDPEVDGGVHQALIRNPIQVPKSITQYRALPSSIVPVPVRNNSKKPEPRNNDAVERAGYYDDSLETNKCSKTSQTSKKMRTSDLMNMMFRTNYSDTLPNRDSDNSITKYSTSYSTLNAFDDSQPPISTSAYQPNNIATLSTTSNGNSSVSCMMGVRNDEYVEPGYVFLGERRSSAFDSVASCTHSSIAASSSILSTSESDTKKNANSSCLKQGENQHSTAQAYEDVGTSDFKSTVFVNQSNTPQTQTKKTMNVTYASHYQDGTTLDCGNSMEASIADNNTGGLKEQGNRAMGGTFVVNDVDFTVDFAEGKTFDIESVTKSALETTFADTEADTFDRDCEALITILEKAVWVKHPSQSRKDSRMSRKNLDRLRPFSTPMVGGGRPTPKTNPRDPAEQEFVQYLVKSWEPAARRRSNRNREPPGRNDSVENRPPGRGVKHPEKTSAILKSWFHEHMSYPYPTPGDISTLALATGLTKVQLGAWFTYTRRQAKKAGISSSNMEIEL